MKLRHVTIDGFRSLKSVSVPISDTTVIVGENNAGKTAFIEAIKSVLSRAGNRSIHFDDYDYHLSRESSTATEKRANMAICLLFREDQSDEWPESLMQALSEVIQTDPVTDLDSIYLRVKSEYDEVLKEYVTHTEFLNLNGESLQGKAAGAAILSRFLNYVRLFYLPAQRDSNMEFSSRSQYWGKILRSINVSADQLRDIESEVGKLNEALLSADPRMTNLKDSLDKIQGVMPLSHQTKSSIQAVPIRPWDLMARAEVVLKDTDTDITLPLNRYGQGMQSLAVVFLFQAYIEILLKPLFEEETEPIWALEEPEAHLHPHATRSLSKNLSLLKGQKLITSHSPFFVQEVPFTNILLFRPSKVGTVIRYVKRSYEAEIIPLVGRENFEQISSKLRVVGRTLVCEGLMTQDEYRKVLPLVDRSCHAALKQMFNDSQAYLTPGDLDALNTYAKRVRGEVLFAKAWLLCEGQSEYIVLRYFADVMGKSLDVHGITVIDFQNNGSPGAFVGLAENLGVPWVLLCDNDQAGQDFKRQVEKRGILGERLNNDVKLLPESGMDLELYLTTRL